MRRRQGNAISLSEYSFLEFALATGFQGQLFLHHAAGLHAGVLRTEMKYFVLYLSHYLSVCVFELSIRLLESLLTQTLCGSDALARRFRRHFCTSYGYGN